MKLSLHTKLDQLALRLDELDAMLSAEDATRDLDRYRSLTKEHAEIGPVVARFREYLAAEHDLVTADEIAQDPGMRAFAEEERATATQKMTSLAADLQRMLLPKDPNDERNVFLEIRAGTGGDEAALFAGDLFRMYTRYAERNGWQVEIVSAIAGRARRLQGGRSCASSGQGAYSQLKFESGGHRVQRVPETEAQGRIHTSACTVAVLPEADRSPTSTINPADLRIDTFRASGAGGQHVNKTDSAVRITHLPTGHRRRMPGRPLAAPQPRAGDGGAGVAPAAKEQSASGSAKEAAQRKSLDRLAAIAASASAPTISRRAA